MQEELKARGGRILAIAVDPPEKSRRVVERNGLPFAILADVSRETVRAYGLLHPGAGPGGSDVALPANLLVDREGKIVFRHLAESVQDRADPEALRAAVRDLPAGSTDR